MAKKVTDYNFTIFHMGGGYDVYRYMIDNGMLTFVGNSSGSQDEEIPFRGISPDKRAHALKLIKERRQTLVAEMKQIDRFLLSASDAKKFQNITQDPTVPVVPTEPVLPGGLGGL